MSYQYQYNSSLIPTKSQCKALLLSFLLGPIGMFYATVTGAIIMSIITLVIIIFPTGIGLIVLWPIQLIWTTIAVNSYNKKVLNRIIYFRCETLKMRAYNM